MARDNCFSNSPGGLIVWDDCFKPKWWTSSQMLFIGPWVVFRDSIMLCIKFGVELWRFFFSWNNAINPLPWVTSCPSQSLTLLHAGDKGGKVVVQQDHVSRLLGNVRSGNPHSDTNVSLLQRWRVIHAITSHGNNGSLDGEEIKKRWWKMTNKDFAQFALPPLQNEWSTKYCIMHLSLAAFHNDQFLLRRGSGKDNLSVVLQNVIKLLWGQVLKVSTMDDTCFSIPAAKFRSL